MVQTATKVEARAAKQLKTTKTNPRPGAIIAQIIRARREELRIGQKELAEMVDAHPQTMNKIERGEIEFSRFFHKIEQRLGLPEGALTKPENASVLHLAPPPPPARKGKSGVESRPLSAKSELSAGVDMPLFASSTTAGGRMIPSARSIGITIRPAPLAMVRDAYAMLVSTATMEPVYMPGDMVWLHPHLPPEDQKDVLLRRDSEIGEMILGRLIKTSLTHWVVVEWHGSGKGQEHRYSRKEFPVCHRVIGKLCR